MPTTLESNSFDTLQPFSYPERAGITSCRFGASLTLAKGTVVGTKTADGLVYAYSGAATNGLAVALGITKFAIQTDASGNVYLGDQGTNATSLNVPQKDAAVYFAGVFDITELTGWDGTARTSLNARNFPGMSTNIVYIP